jgi:hypothetical protein
MAEKLSRLRLSTGTSARLSARAPTLAPSCVAALTLKDLRLADAHSHRISSGTPKARVLSAEKALALGLFARLGRPRRYGI